MGIRVREWGGPRWVIFGTAWGLPQKRHKWDVEVFMDGPARAEVVWAGLGTTFSARKHES